MLSRWPNELGDWYHQAMDYGLRNPEFFTLKIYQLREAKYALVG